MDFIDTLKSIKKELKTQEIKNSKKEQIDEQMKEFLAKEQKMQDEFLEFMKDNDIKKI